MSLFKQIRVYSREASSDPFVYQGSCQIDATAVNYESYAPMMGLKPGQECMVLIEGLQYAYTFMVKG